MVKAIGGHFLDAIGHRSHASENPAKTALPQNIAQLQQQATFAPLSPVPYTSIFRKITQK
jgi:hypothetical protein